MWFVGVLMRAYHKKYLTALLFCRAELIYDLRIYMEGFIASSTTDPELAEAKDLGM